MYLVVLLFGCTDGGPTPAKRSSPACPGEKKNAQLNSRTFLLIFVYKLMFAFDVFFFY